jgi:hypothetical protein
MSLRILLEMINGIFHFQVYQLRKGKASQLAYGMETILRISLTYDGASEVKLSD